LSLAGAVRPTEGDVLYAAQRQRSRIIERTLRGVDVDGSPFEPYSTAGPYYYYPQGPGHGFTGPMTRDQSKRHLQARKGAVRRLLHITGDVTANRSEYMGYEGIGGVKTRSGVGIRFESYADFKASIGRAGVDLTGPRAPHMLQAITVAVNDRDLGTSDSSTAGSAPAQAFSLGIYGEAAGRASGHNTGLNPRWKGKHQRYFFGASAGDLKDIVGDIYARMMARLKRKA
jgi:hypothetical protein